MSSTATQPHQSMSSQWFFARPLPELPASGASMVRLNGKQIALFNTSRGVKACDNRCPHEGFPLSEGSVSEDCKLTCNWHNWKFDLESGENLLGGDTLRTYPVEIRNGEIWIDIADPPFLVQQANIINSLKDAFEAHSYDRISREIARLICLGGDPLEALRMSIQWSWQKMEFGWTHAYAGMADWLTLFEENVGDDETQLVCLVESVAHTALDVLREQNYDYNVSPIEFKESQFLKYVEDEDQSGACGSIVGALDAGMTFFDLEHALCKAALAHYNDFGHSLIYVTKAGLLVEKLGSDTAKPLLLSLVRSIVYAAREDKTPEFKAYAPALAAWGKNNASSNVMPYQWRRLGIKSSLEATVRCSAADPVAIYQELLETNAINLLGFDIDHQDKTHVSISGNVGWFDYTHGITFANAVRKVCEKYPLLWPKGLLQMACFCGRNAAHTTSDYQLELWRSENGHREVRELLQQVIDHGQAEYIVSVHWLKTTLAVREEIDNLDEDRIEIIVAGLKRFIESPNKRRQTRRTAYQSLKFVSKK